MSHVSGLMGTAANVQLRTDGSIALATGCVDIGQGSDTVHGADLRRRACASRSSA